MKLSKKLFFLFAIALLGFLTSCSQQKYIAYYQNIDQLSTENAQKSFESQIQPDDLLLILVSAADPEIAAPFNLGVFVNSSTTNQSVAGQQQQQLYLVNSQGNIQFPVLGEISMAGKTKEEATTELKNKLKLYIKDAIVNIRIMNFKITVQGEVAKPGIFTIASERVTLPEALSLAGDLTIYGKRNNIILVREINNKKTFNRIDITKADFINSPFYYLSQNDLVYVEPNKGKSNTSTGFTQNGSIWIAIASLVSSVVLSIFIINKK
jgi:polysaccharide export outer membrane protein